MKIHNCKQGSDEWFLCRKSKMSASHAQAIGNCGKGLETSQVFSRRESWPISLQVLDHGLMTTKRAFQNLAD
jgi:hypothetical protein